MSPAVGEPLPWYRHFWPWFIVGLLGSAVGGGIATVVIAFRHADALVRDDYYREGVAINRRLHGEQEARRLGVRASLHLDGPRVVLSLKGSGGVADVSALRLELSHATLAERDVTAQLSRSGPGRFEGLAPGVEGATGRFYATLEPVDEREAGGGWRLARTIALPATGAIALDSGRGP